MWQMRAAFISYCVVSNAEVAKKFPTMLMNDIGITDTCTVCSAFSVTAGQMNSAQQATIIC